MLVREIIQRIQSLYSKGAQSDDSRLTSRHIYNKLLTVRAKLLSEQSKKKQFVSQGNYQAIPCIELVQATIHDCQCTVPFGCKILKSKHPLPKPLSNYDNHLIQYVTSLDGNTVYSETSWVAKKYKSSNKYTAFRPDWFIRNDNIFVTYKDGPRVITISGLFEDPFEAAKYPSCECTDDNCNDCMSPLDMTFPMDNALIEPMIELSVNELIVMFSQAIEDASNNSRDSTIEQSK